MEEYSFKDILIGFRKYYLNISKQLKELEDKIKIIDDTLSKCIVILNNDNDMISCYFYNLEKSIIDAIINIEKQLGMPIFHLDNLELDKDIKNLYHFKNNLKHYHIIIENIREFNDNVLRILKNDYTNILKKNTIELSKDNQLFMLSYDYNSLSEEIIGTDNIGSIAYYPKDDFIHIDHLSNLSQDDLNQILNVKFNKNYFNEQQRNLFENNKKDIILNANNGYEFNIEETKKTLILNRR